MTSAIVVDNEGRTDPYAEQQAIGGRCAQHEDVRIVTTEQTVDGYLSFPPTDTARRPHGVSRARLDP